MPTRKLKSVPHENYYIKLKKESKRQRKLRQHKDLHKEFEKIVLADPLIRNGMVPEHKFNPVRQFTLDYAWPHLKIGVDLQGGIYKPGRRTGHVSVKGMENDMEKLNLALSNGWLMLLFSPNKVFYRPMYVNRVLRAVHMIRNPSLSRKY